MKNLKLSRRQFLMLSVGTYAGFSRKISFGCGTKDKPLRIRKKADIFTLDPINFRKDDEVILRNVLAPLVRVKDKSYINHIVAEIEVVNDNKIFKFDLRKEKWSDGSIVEANDVKYSFERFLNEKLNVEAEHRNQWEGLEKVNILNSYSGSIEFNKPKPDFLNSILPYGYGCIVSKDAVERLEDKKIGGDPGKTSGRYVIVEIVQGDRIVLV